MSSTEENERGLQTAHEQYRLLFERNPLPGWVFDIETLAFLEVNQEAVRHYGYSREEFLGMTLRDLRPAEEMPKLQESLKSLPPGLARPGIWTHRKKDGSLIRVEVFNYPVTFHEHPARLALINDVTEHEEREEMLKETSRLSALTESAAILAHEIANPLNGIFTILQILLEESEIQDAKSRGLLQEASKEIKRLSDLLQEFRILARPEDINREPIALAELINDALAMETPEYLKRGIRVEHELAPDCPPVNADGPKLKQVLLNLCRNAVEAMPHGGVLKVRTYRGARQLYIEISDTGTGIPEGTDIFAPFATTKAEGTGLGLTIVKKIVSAHGGTVTHKPRAVQGTDFTVSLPLEPES
jgi:two-component system, cell cycle sensor histidine kinase and response regulator CckA